MWYILLENLKNVEFQGKNGVLRGRIMSNYVK